MENLIKSLKASYTSLERVEIEAVFFSENFEQKLNSDDEIEVQVTMIRKEAKEMHDRYIL